MAKKFHFSIAAIVVLVLTCACNQHGNSRRVVSRPQTPPNSYLDEDETGESDNTAIPQIIDGEITPRTLNDACQEVTKWRPPKSLDDLSNLRKRFVVAHNRVREIYGLPKFTWDQELADYAQEWADHLKTTNNCQMHHRSSVDRRDGKSYGENLAWNWTSRQLPSAMFDYSPERVVHAWSRECADYDYDSNSCAGGKQCGHFTQNVWRSTSTVGCGVAICDGDENHMGYGRSEIWVCNYHQPGNVIEIRRSGGHVPRKPF